MNNLPIELQKIIFNYTNCKCHTCFRKILSYSQYNNCIKVKNFIFCSQECYDHI